MKNKNLNNNQPAIILGLFETALGIARSLGRKGISVYGIDKSKDIGFYSKYIKATLCPDPVLYEDKFINWLENYISGFNEKPILYFTSDDYLMAFTKNRDMFEDKVSYILPEHDFLEKVADKYSQYNLAKEANVAVPETKIVSKSAYVNDFKGMDYPLFIKGLEVNSWRIVFGGTQKGFLINDEDDLIKVLTEIKKHNIKAIVQEVIPGPDQHHFKYCTLRDNEGNELNKFTLKKIRQYPPHFGVGSVVESVSNKKLEKAGKQFFDKIKYKGVGSAEFKLDQRDGKWKLIELNPRYWQQNSLAYSTGADFALNQYLSLTNQKIKEQKNFETGVKWINIYMDFASFLKYRKEGEITFWKWLRSLKGPKVFSDFAWDDLKPFLYEWGFGLKLLKAPVFLINKLIK